MVRPCTLDDHMSSAFMWALLSAQAQHSEISEDALSCPPVSRSRGTHLAPEESLVTHTRPQGLFGEDTFLKRRDLS